jgi:hypothetical protein
MARLNAEHPNYAVITAAAVLGLLFLAASVVYATHRAEALPRFLPGYSAHDISVHYKHAVAALVLSLLCFIGAWFAAGPKQA